MRNESSSSSAHKDGLVIPCKHRIDKERNVELREREQKGKKNVRKKSQSKKFSQWKVSSFPLPHQCAVKRTQTQTQTVWKRDRDEKYDKVNKKWRKITCDAGIQQLPLMEYWSSTAPAIREEEEENEIKERRRESKTGRSQQDKTTSQNKRLNGGKMNHTKRIVALTRNKQWRRKNARE